MRELYRACTMWAHAGTMEWIVSPLILLLLCATSGRSYADDGLRQQFLKEYPKGAAALQSFYSQCRIRSTQTRFADGKMLFVNRLIYSVNRDLAQVTAVKKDGVPASDLDEEAVLLITANNAYSLLKFPRTDKFVLQLPKNRSKVWSTLRRDVLPAYAPYCFHGVRFVDFMSHPSFRIIDVSSLNDGEKQLIKVEWESKVVEDPDAPAGYYNRGVTLVCPRDSWAIAECDVSVHDDSDGLVLRNTMSVSYGQRVKNIPLVDSVIFSTVRAPGGSPRVTKHDEISITPETVSPEEFTLHAYGIEQLAKPDGSRWNAFFVAGNVLLVVSLLFLYLSRRARRRSAA
jgi:hypothetical protein